MVNYFQCNRLNLYLAAFLAGICCTTPVGAQSHGNDQFLRGTVFEILLPDEKPLLRGPVIYTGDTYSKTYSRTSEPRQINPQPVHYYKKYPQAPRQSSRSEPVWSVYASTGGKILKYKGTNEFGADFGTQFINETELRLSRKKLFSDHDSLSINIDTGVYRNDTKGSNTKNNITLAINAKQTAPIDTIINIEYSTFNNVDSGLSAGVEFNIPTGRAATHIDEFLSEPLDSQAYDDQQGSGFDVIGTLTYNERLGDLTWYAGPGIGYRGGYDEFSDLNNREMAAGVEYQALAGLKFSPSKHWDLAADLTLAHTDAYENSIRDLAQLGIPITYYSNDYMLRLHYLASIEDSTADHYNKTVRNRTRAQKINQLLLLLGKYKLTDNVNITGSAEWQTEHSHYVGISGKDLQENKITMGTGLDWKIPDTNLSLSMEGEYFWLASEKFIFEDVDYTGFTLSAGISTSFEH